MHVNAQGCICSGIAALACAERRPHACALLHINLGRFLSRLRRVFRVFANYFGGCSLFFILFHRLFVLSDISCIWHKFILSFQKSFCNKIGFYLN